VFVQDAAIANMAEIELGRLALRNASDAQVRSFGQRMIDDHQKAQSDLEAVARRMNLELPSGLDSHHAQTARQLAALSGTEFDSQYINTMVREHRNAIALFESRGQSQPQNEVRNFAINTLPHLRHHLQQAQDLQTRMGR
jgi:putative membrane protein